MKKTIFMLLLFTILISSAFSVNIFLGNADSQSYARIINDQTPFYSDSGGRNLLFYLPYTYYVKVLSNDGALSHVECYGAGRTAALDGYVPTDLLFYDGLTVQNPNVQLEITAASTAVLYYESGLKHVSQYIFKGRSMTYYGSIPTNDGSYIYYVGYNNRLGYVIEAEVVPFVIPNHPNELTFLIPDTPEPPINEVLPDNGASDKNTNSNHQITLQILIISSLLFAGIIALVITVRKKPSNRHTATSYYDENDFE